ncbi:MAG: ornithine cyclodeaminase [Pseudomonadota bacterium]|nr:ornithine cyclodeaminase [Pseudomonadota bacterium]
MTLPYITAEIADARLTWPEVVAALEAGHRLPRADVGDLFLGPPTGTLMSRGAYIEGLGYGVKTFTVTDGNAARGLPTVQGAMLVFDAATGTPKAIIDSGLVTKWKTAADSVLGARLLARPESRHLVIVGAGTVARNLAAAYAALFPDLDRITFWARRREQAEVLVGEIGSDGPQIAVADDLERAVREADIVSSATMAREPILKGDWLRPGTHVDLIGAFKADMREADDEVLRRGTLFADSRATTLHHIGEYLIPLQAGVITEGDLRADFYDLIAGGGTGRSDPDEITVFKNGGGAHLDLMTASAISAAVGGVIDAPDRSFI